MTMKLPTNYTKLSSKGRAAARAQYVREQNGLCWHCKAPLDEDPPKEITDKKLNWDLFPKNFMDNPIHLQHNHLNHQTEGAVHAYCNAVLWQYHGR